MHNSLTPLGRIVALVSVILFVPAALIALSLANLPHTMLNAETYKRLLVEWDAYEHIPALAAEQAPAFARSLGGPCLDDPLGCVTSGDSPLVLDCVVDAIGAVQYHEIESGARLPTQAEQDASLPCLLRIASLETIDPEGPADVNPLPGLPPTVQACVRTELGEQAYGALLNSERERTLRETRRINACIREARRESRAEIPGISVELAPILEGLSPVEWEELLRFLLPPVQLHLMADSALDAAFDYLNGRSDSISVSLLPLKRDLMGETGREVGLMLLRFEPPCTADQIARIDQGEFENGGGTALYCAASGATLAMMAPGMQTRIQMVAEQLPDELVLVDRFTDPLGLDLTRLNLWIRLSPLLPVLLLAVAAVALRARWRLLRWWGIPLLVAGLFGVALCFIVHPAVEWGWLYLPPGATSHLTSGLGALARDLVNTAAAEFRLWIFIEAALMMLLGMTAVTIARQIHPR